MAAHVALLSSQVADLRLDGNRREELTTASHSQIRTELRDLRALVKELCSGMARLHGQSMHQPQLLQQPPPPQQQQSHHQQNHHQQHQQQQLQQQQQHQQQKQQQQEQFLVSQKQQGQFLFSQKSQQQPMQQLPFTPIHVSTTAAPVLAPDLGPSFNELHLVLEQQHQHQRPVTASVPNLSVSQQAYQPVHDQLYSEQLQLQRQQQQLAVAQRPALIQPPPLSWSAVLQPFSHAFFISRQHLFN